MFRSLHRPIGYVAVGLGLASLVPLSGLVGTPPAQAQQNTLRGSFIPYQNPGQWRPRQMSMQGQFAGNNQGNNQQGNNQQGNNQQGGGFNIGGGGGGFNIGGGGGGFGGKIGFGGEYGI